MNDIQIASVVTVNSTSVFLERLGHSDVTSNRSSLVDFLLHVLFANNSAELFDSIDHVLVWDEAGLTWIAVATHVHGRADLTIVVALSTIDGASLVSDLVIGHPLKRVIRISSMATIVLGLARDDDLRGDVDIGPGGLTGNLYPIRDGGSGSVGPA